ncbi:MAG: Uma2 family endonuclease [Saprospiraceae bacterium]|jgi:Uma2 family endonuclease|nr:Uma2 family endonuclease [Saprospiraceae bacterium]
MTAAKTEIYPATASAEQPAPAEPITWEVFEKEYLSREDGYKYEWVRGEVVQTPRDMNQYQYYILDNLQEYFTRLRFEGKVTGKLYPEIDTFFLKKVHRRPDMAWFTDEQVARMAHRENQVPNFVIEIVSDHDIVDNLLDKLGDYREAGVAVIWLISPRLEQIHVYSGDKNIICRGGDQCSAAPALSDFRISANDIFRKPDLP